MATTSGHTARAERANATREAILSTAERLFAEHGVHAVSNRQVSEAAGQGNNAAVNYHFGTKTDLVRAIVRRRTAEVDRLRTELVSATTGSAEVRDWVACLVRPMTTYLDQLGSPTWFARFSTQLFTDPVLREIVVEESMTSAALVRTVEGLHGCLSSLPPAVRAERGDMARILMMHVTAERERALAEGALTPHATWDHAATGLIDAITGMWLAPSTASA